MTPGGLNEAEQIQRTSDHRDLESGGTRADGERPSVVNTKSSKQLTTSGSQSTAACMIPMFCPSRAHGVSSALASFLLRSCWPLSHGHLSNRLYVLTLQQQLATDQVVQWEANYFGPGGNDFYIHHNTNPLLTEIPLSTNLVSGLNTGTQFLTAGNYEISIQFLGMGGGNYTIIF